MKARTSFSARDQAMPLPTSTSGFLAFWSRSNAASIFSCGAIMRGGSGTRSTWVALSRSHLPGDDVVGHVEVAGTGTAIDRVPGRHLHVVGNARHALDAVRKLAERRGDQHLALLLEGAHAAAIGLRGAADQDHRPAVLLRVGETSEAVDDAWAGHRDARAGPARQIAVGPGRVGGGLLVAHADVGDAFFLRRCCDRADRKPDNPEQVIDALLLEAPRHQGSAVDFTHLFPPRDWHDFSRPDYALIAGSRKGFAERKRQLCIKNTIKQPTSTHLPQTTNAMRAAADVNRLRTRDQDGRRRVDHPLGCDEAAPGLEARS